MMLATGIRLGPYEVVELVGAGGMGEVYKGRDTRLGRTVALKVVLAPALAGDDGWRQRLEREAWIVAESSAHLTRLRRDGKKFIVTAPAGEEEPITVITNWKSALQK